MLLPEAIAVGKSRTGTSQFLCCLFSQTKFLPLRYLQGLQIELEVVAHYSDVCIEQRMQCYGAQGSTRWFIEEPCVKCGVITVDNQLDSEYTIT